MKEMMHYLKPYWRGLLAATIAVAISTVCDLLLPAIMSEILNKGVYRADFAYIVRCCAIMAAVALVALLENGKFSAEEQAIVDEINNRPMRVLGYRTPAEAFTDELPSLTQQQGYCTSK